MLNIVSVVDNFIVVNRAFQVSGRPPTRPFDQVSGLGCVAKANWQESD